MAHIDHHAPGSFCWIELGTTEQDAAKQFYGTLFGWKANDFPMGPSGVYTMFELDGRQAGATYTLDAEMRKHGVPPHWMTYVSVTSADESAAKATQLGGKVMNGPFDVMDFGRMAVLQDPTGAVFSVWQPNTHQGTGITGVPGTLCWADLSTTDSGKAGEFYKGLFGWELMPGDNEYVHIKNGEAFIGGIPPAKHRNPNAPPHWLAYFYVTDCDASTEQAKSAGANIYMGPMSIEKVGRMTVVADPQGAVFALFQPFPRE